MSKRVNKENRKRAFEIECERTNNFFYKWKYGIRRNKY